MALVDLVIAVDFFSGDNFNSLSNVVLNGPR